MRVKKMKIPKYRILTIDAKELVELELAGSSFNIYDDENKIEIAKSGKNIGSSCVFGIEHCGAVAFIGNGVFFKNGFTAGGAIMVVFRNLGSAFRTEHSDDLLFFF